MFESVGGRFGLGPTGLGISPQVLLRPPGIYLSARCFRTAAGLPGASARLRGASACICCSGTSVPSSCLYLWGDRSTRWIWVWLRITGLRCLYRPIETAETDPRSIQQKKAVAYRRLHDLLWCRGFGHAIISAGQVLRRPTNNVRAAVHEKWIRLVPRWA